MGQHQSAMAAAPETAADAGLLDTDLLGEMASDFGAEMLDELRLSFEQEARQAFAALAEAVRADDAEEAAAQLHAVRGAGLAIGCAAFGAAAQQHELAAKAGTVPGAGAVTGLEDLLARSLSALAAYAAEAAD